MHLTPACCPPAHLPLLRLRPITHMDPCFTLPPSIEAEPETPEEQGGTATPVEDQPTDSACVVTAPVASLQGAESTKQPSHLGRKQQQHSTDVKPSRLSYSTLESSSRAALGVTPSAFGSSSSLGSRATFADLINGARAGGSLSATADLESEVRGGLEAGSSSGGLGSLGGSALPKNAAARSRKPVRPDLTTAYMTQCIMPQHANTQHITFGGQVWWAGGWVAGFF